MTNKHCFALADHIRELQKTESALTDIQIEELSVFCSNQNPRFDMFKWMEYIHSGK